MNNADHYKNLDSGEITRVAHAWGQEFPTINKIYLYRAFRPPNKYIILVGLFNPTELNQIAKSLSYESFEKYVKESPDYLPFFSQAVKKNTYGNLDEKVPVEFQQGFLKYAFDQFLKYWRTSIQHEFKRDLNEAYPTSERNLTPIWIFHIEIPEQELPEGVYQNSKEIYQDSPLLIYERKNVSISAINTQPSKEFSPNQKHKNGDPKQSHDTFIKNLRIYYENDNEIKIQEPGKGPEAHTCQTMKFRDNQTNAWKAFIKILQEPPHIYNAGPAHENLNGERRRVKQYDSKLKCLSDINGKLLNFLNQQFKAGIPEDYKLYGKCKAEESGTFKFKFQVALDDTIKSSNKNKYEKMSEGELIKLLTEMYKEYARSPEETHKYKMQTISEVLVQKYRFTQSEIKNMLNSEREDIRYDPYENVEDKEKDY